jgi:hypothetical protein
MLKTFEWRRFPFTAGGDQTEEQRGEMIKPIALLDDRALTYGSCKHG